MATLIRQVKKVQDSVGGTVACMCTKVPAGLGEPVFDRLEVRAPASARPPAGSAPPARPTAAPPRSRRRPIARLRR